MQILISTLNGSVGLYNSANGNLSQVISPNINLRDIAVASNGSLYGISSSGLYRINRTNGISSFIGSTRVSGLNGLTFASNNRLYATRPNSSNLYQINLTTGRASIVANLGLNFDSSGDLVFDAANNRFLAISEEFGSDSLYSIRFNSRTNSVLSVQRVGSIGFRDVWGLSLSQGQLKGYTGGGRVITINPFTGAGSFSQNLPILDGRISGAADLGNTVLLSTLQGDIGFFQPSSKILSKVIAPDIALTDIAIAPNRQLFGITNSALYRINQNTGLETRIGSLRTGGLDSLSFAPDGRLYATQSNSSNFYSINTATGRATAIATLGLNFNSSGDLVFDAANRRFLATSVERKQRCTVFHWI